MGRTVSVWKLLEPAEVFWDTFRNGRLPKEIVLPVARMFLVLSDEGGVSWRGSRKIQLLRFPYYMKQVLIRE